LDQLIEINFDERIQFMKKFSSKLIIFFVALCFSLTLCGSIKAAEGQKININTASKEELIELQKIGPQKAEAIINYRENVGSFQKPEDIMNVSGIGEATYEINKDIIVVNPPISE
jgi:competence protein ComEA